MTYGYDQAGNRVLYTTGGSTTIYPNKYYNKNGSTETKHIFANGIVIASIEDGEVLYDHTDHLSGSNAISNDEAEVVQTLDYYPFGDIRINESSGFDEQKKFTGFEHDDETDLEYAQARYYNANIGKFISADPLVNDLGINRYGR